MNPGRGIARNQPKAGRVQVTVLAAFMFLSLAIFIVWLMLLPSMDRRSLLDLFNRHAETASSGVSENEYPRLAESIAEFLAGRRLSAQIEVEASDGFRAAFHDHELVHLQDVKTLLDLARWLLYAFLTLMTIAALLFIRGQALHQQLSAPFLLRSVRMAAGTLFLLIIGAVLWVILDFSRAFTTLHHLAFRNELWLLDPWQDLLIQLMPQSFFTEYALQGIKKIGVMLAGVLVLVQCIGLIEKWRQNWTAAKKPALKPED